MIDGSRWGGRAKWLLGGLVAAVAVVPSLWLAVLDQRTTGRLVDEVERGLRSDAQLFAEQLSQSAEQLLIEQHVRPLVDATGFYVTDPEGSGATFYEVDLSEQAQHLIEYPFLVDFSDTTILSGKGAEHTDEVSHILRSQIFLAPVRNRSPRGRGMIVGPYGPFHYAYAVDSGSATGGRLLRGVKLNARAVLRLVLPDAFARMRETVAEQQGRDAFPDGSYAIMVETPDTLVVLTGRPLRNAPERAVGTYERSLGVGGLFPDWTVRVHYVNELKARRWRSYVASLIPLLIVIGGVIVAARMAMRESELNHVKTLFVSNVSHELKTPLTKINLFNDLLQRLSDPDPEKRQRYHRIIQQECERLGMLVDNVLDLGRIERGKMDYNFEELAVEEILNEVAETFDVIYEARGYSIDLEIEEGLPAVNVDPGAMKQALINLTDNAVKYSERPHMLEVRARRSRLQGKPAVSISVTDQGIGIPKEHIALIFEEFYRSESGQQHRASGSGLGLALVRHIVDAHNGTISVDSKVGAGSTFTISLPAIRRNETESQ